MQSRVEILRDRVIARVKELGLSERYVSLQATGKPDAIRDIKRGRMPDAGRVKDLADVLRTSMAALLGDEDVAPYDKATAGPPRAGEANILEFKTKPRDRQAPPLGFEAVNERAYVPVYGSALGADMIVEDDGTMRVQRIMVNEAAEIGRLRLLPGLEGKRDVYGLYVVGDSMEPRYFQGDPVYVDPHRPASPGDFVIVQLEPEDAVHHDGLVCALVKRLVRQNSDFVWLEQYNPPIRFSVPMGHVHAVHRILTPRELAED